MTSTLVPSGPASLPTDDGPRWLIDRFLPTYDVAVTEHAVVAAPASEVYAAAAGLDFMTIRTPLLVASMFVRGLPARLRGTAPPRPPRLCLLDDRDDVGLPGWLLLGVEDGHEIAFGAVGKFWQPSIEWRDVPRDDFTSFAEPGWGKIACHFLVRPVDERTVVSYECRVATTNSAAARRMARYWWLIRPFVASIMRATLRTIAGDARIGRR